MTRLYLIRHGATTLNQEAPYRLQGRLLDPPLAPLGRQQALRAANQLAQRPIAAVYASPLLRSRETAALVAAPHRLEPVVVPDLIEADLGRWEGLTWEQARALDPEYHDRFLAHPGTVPYPGGESFFDVQVRVTPVLAGLAAEHPDAEITVVGHNVLNRAYLAGLLGLPIDRARPLRQANGGINVIEFEGAEARVVTLNAAFHLDGLGPEGRKSLRRHP
ncbi:MAG: histidine phosphatase family protein [Isosphaeraceae bacterium]|nr:histidine phosphatase family protein [Isosphaeraceae bacterium]